MEEGRPRFTLESRQPRHECWDTIANDDNAPPDLRRLATGAYETPVMGAAGYAECLDYLLRHYGTTTMVRTIPGGRSDSDVRR